MRACAILTVLFAGAVIAADEKPAIKDVALKNSIPAISKDGPSPLMIGSLEELGKVKMLQPDLDEIKKQVDFSKEKLVVFCWGGSGQDKLTSELKTSDKKATAVFTKTPGRTRDFKLHLHAFAVPKDAEVKVEGGK